jgi:hypothetical protein
MAKFMIVIAMKVMPEYINIGRPAPAVIVWAIIFFIIWPIPTRPSVPIVAVSFATRQRPDD